MVVTMKLHGYQRLFVIYTCQRLHELVTECRQVVNTGIEIGLGVDLLSTLR